MATKTLIRNSISLSFLTDEEVPNKPGEYKMASKSYNLRNTATAEQVLAFVSAITPLCDYEFNESYINEKHLVQ